MNRIRNQLSALWAHVFIIFAGLYALPHTVWSASTIVQGVEPMWGWGWLGWAFSGVLMGMTIDVGLIVISIQIARGEGTKARLAAFGALSAGVFFCQWYYAIAHTPVTTLGPGMAGITSWVVIGLQNFGVWLIPLFVPLVITIYTFGHRTHKPPVQTATITRQTRTETIKVERPDQPRIESVPVPQLEAGVTVQCDVCGTEYTKTTQAGANSALRMHKRHKHKETIDANLSN
jgi:hypothetical protein